MLGRALARAEHHDRLLAYARRLRESNRDLDSFAAAVAHDLRQPLRQLNSYVEILFEHLDVDEFDADAHHYASRIRTAVGRADQLIVALLDYASAGGKALADVEVALDRLVADVIDGLRLQLEEAGATVQFEHLPTVQGDPDLLRQVFQNLIQNAAKYRAPIRAAEIVVSAEAEERDSDDPTPCWRISVEDNGIGIDPAHADRIFDVFTRAERGNELSGTGIGLASAKRVVERHGGRIGVDSTPGVGSRFWFTLPGVAGRHRY
jgi:signal transduction histidine kinase